MYRDSRGAVPAPHPSKLPAGARQSYPIITSGSAGLFIEEGKILIARRAEGRHLAGFWEFPGGKQEAGESILRCLEREIHEEFGVACRARRVVCETVYEYDQGAIRLVGVAADLVERDIALSVHDDYRWVDIADLERYRLAPADIALAREMPREMQRECP
jgi:8-oxo-dGTP diphosphatase